MKSSSGMGIGAIPVGVAATVAAAVAYGILEVIASPTEAGSYLGTGL